MATDHLSTTFAALADPTRRAILARLAQGEATVNELAEPFALSLPAVSKHLKVLQRAGLVSQGRRAQWRPCRLETAPLHEVANWMEDYRQFWDESFDRLDDYLHELQAQGTGTRTGKGKLPWSRRLDAATTFTTPSDREITHDARLRRAARARLPGTHGPKSHRTVVGTATSDHHRRDVGRETRRRLALRPARPGGQRVRLPRRVPRGRAPRAARLHL